MVRTGIAIIVLLAPRIVWAVFGVGDVVSAPNLEGMFAAKWAEEAGQWAEKVQQWQMTSSRWVQSASHMQKQIQEWQRLKKQARSSEGYRDVRHFGSSTKQLVEMSSVIARQTLAIQKKREQLNAMSQQFLHLQSDRKQYRQLRSECLTWLQTRQALPAADSAQKRFRTCMRIVNGMNPISWKNHFADLGDEMIDHAAQVAAVSDRIHRVRDSISDLIATDKGTEKDLQIATNKLLITLQEVQEVSSHRLAAIHLRTEEILHGLLVFRQREDAERSSANMRIDQTLRNIFRMEGKGKELRTP